MRLVFIIENLNFGGGSYFIFKLAEALAVWNHTVVIFCARYPIFFRNYTLPQTLTIRSRKAIPHLFKGCGKINQICEIIYDCLFLKRYLSKNCGVDFIIGYQRKSAIKALKLAEKYAISLATFIFESPNWLEQQLREEWLKYYKKPQLRKSWNLFKETLLRSDVIFTISHATKKEAAKWLGKHIDAVVCPGINMNAVDSIPSQKQEDRIIYVGRLQKTKNIDEVIKALNQIKNPPKLIICGSGPEKQNLKTLANKLSVNFEFRGMVSDDEKWKIISECKFMVFPSSFEGFGIPPMEALACSIPCICSDIPVLREAYEDKIEYFEEHNIDILVEKIQYLMNNPDYCKKRGKKGKKYVRNKFSWKRSAKKIEQILGEHLDGKKQK